MVVTRDVPKDADQTDADRAPTTTLVAPIASKVVGTITTDVTAAPNPRRASRALGDLIADAQVDRPVGRHRRRRRRSSRS